jgi:predicted N-acetyltransferase YhbS
MYYQGVFIGLLSFCIIGVFHPLVVKTEYYFGKKVWWIFGILGLFFVILSIWISSLLGSAISALFGFSCLWTVKEMFEQESRVKKGWFPANPNRKGVAEVRPETPDDYAALRRVYEQTFGRLDEAFWVETLRKERAFSQNLSLVAAKNNIIVGHILFFPVTIITPEEKEETSLALASLSVYPDFQRQGIGGKLIREGLLIARQWQYRSVITCEYADFYSRFGFRQTSDYGIKSPFDSFGETLMIRELQPQSLSALTGIVRYPSSFHKIAPRKIS